MHCLFFEQGQFGENRARTDTNVAWSQALYLVRKNNLIYLYPRMTSSQKTKRHTERVVTDRTTIADVEAESTRARTTSVVAPTLEPRVGRVREEGGI